MDGFHQYYSSDSSSPLLQNRHPPPFQGNFQPLVITGHQAAYPPPQYNQTYNYPPPPPPPPPHGCPHATDHQQQQMAPQQFPPQSFPLAHSHTHSINGNQMMRYESGQNWVSAGSVQGCTTPQISQGIRFRSQSCQKPIESTAFGETRLESKGVEDKLWVKEWLNRHKLEPKEQQKKAEPETWNLRNLLQQMDTYITVIKEKENSLTENIKNIDFSWEKEHTETLALQQKLESLKKSLQDDSIIVKAVKKIHKKEMRRRKLRERKKAMHLQKENQSRELHEQIDAWQNAIIQKNAEEKQEAQLKKEADETLSEVRKKLADVDRWLHLLAALEQLRQLRKEAAFRKGLKPPEETDEKFTERVAQMRKVIAGQRAVYEAEERTLQVMLDVEQEETKIKEKERQAQRVGQQMQMKRDEICESLFGVPEYKLNEVTFNDEYYSQAFRNIECFLNVRSQWDAFLVPENEGATLPHSWVMSAPPCDTVWSSAVDGDG
ncbi:PREDICTED: programmed cell death protein 7-like [Priapulus caudatus]|uniref:Programmed cell death protein 7-like n=1 Tax=Priapulus caudatus TaxID=37621 RepID=A0ABM1E1Z5_PRICU|nr:PREDICTED: programmed cell death protein 7-like [Priapulus caudatus]